jgi:ABC-type transporter Mla subunit MlaD
MFRRLLCKGRDWWFEPVTNLLKESIMEQAQLATALGSIADSLGDVGTELGKATTEIVTAIGNAGSTTPEVDAAVTRLQNVAASLATAAKALDDLNPDTPPADTGTGEPAAT